VQGNQENNFKGGKIMRNAGISFVMIAIAAMCLSACNSKSYVVGSTVGGTVSGLDEGETLLLKNSDGTELTVMADGTFTFPAKYPNGTTYNVDVKTQPATQTCTLTNSSGTINGVNVTNIVAACAENTYSIGGTLSGLVGTVVLINNGEGEAPLTLTVDGSFTFAVKVADGSAYDVDVLTQPATQTCTVAKGHGIVSGAAVTDVVVTCAMNTYSIGGTVSGLVGTVILINNEDEEDLLTLSVDGSFTFSAKVAAGSPYNVDVYSQPEDPIHQTCTVANGIGTATANVTNIVVTCATNTYTIGGTVSGLVGTVILINNGDEEDPLELTEDGDFEFLSKVADKSPYDVQVKTQPATQTCSVYNGKGTVSGEDVYSVVVTCAVNTYPVGGTLNGLSSGTVVLQNNHGDDLILTTDGVFTFATYVADGSGYDVDVLTQPEHQTCTVANGHGVISGAAITDVVVTCAVNTYFISGTVSGLDGTVVLINNEDEEDLLTLTEDGSFTFTSKVADQSPYKVEVKTQPEHPNQTCTVTNGSGTVEGADVTDVAVTCVTNTYSIGGTLSGLVGTVVLTNNDGDDLTLTANEPFTFATKLEDETTYDVDVKTQPATHTCTVAYGHGKVSGANVTDIEVTCAIDTFVIGGTLTGIGGGQDVVLMNNKDLDDLLDLAENGTFQFNHEVAYGSDYNVEVHDQPAKQICTVTNGTGTATADVNNVSVSCVDAFSIGGTLSGLGSGKTLVLQNNGGDALSLKANAAFTFATKVTTPFAYSVTVSAQPKDQYCVVARGAGTAKDDVSNISVTCTNNKKMFVNNVKTTGDIRVGLSTGIKAADKLCEKQAKGYKAMIVDGTNRRACTTAGCSMEGEHINWVLQANTIYTRNDLKTVVGITNASATFAFPLQNAFSPGANIIWTGLQASWISSTNNCSKWSKGAKGTKGVSGDANVITSTSIYREDSKCNSSFFILCVEE